MIIARFADALVSVGCTNLTAKEVFFIEGLAKLQENFHPGFHANFLERLTLDVRQGRGEFNHPRL